MKRLSDKGFYSPRMWVVNITNPIKRICTLIYHFKYGAGDCRAAVFFLGFFISYSASANQIHVWHKNQRVASTFEFIELGLQKSQYPHAFNVRTIDDNEQAFQALADSSSKNRLDIMVSGVSIAREKNYLPVYVPLDRGLLGFRVCLILPTLQAKFRDINQVSDFAKQQLKLSLVQSWPDVDVMAQNNIPVIESLDYQSAVQKISTEQAQCFSRSVIEVGSESMKLPALAEEQHIALIYPFADIIYVNPNNPELHKALTQGLNLALEDRSFYQLHDSHYSQRLSEHRFYVRKLIVMENENLSEAAHQAINRYGIASFNRLRQQR